MSLRELTKAKHAEAETTAFMKSVFDHEMPTHVWTKFIYNKIFIYETIEDKARSEGLLDGIESICRTSLLRKDYEETGEFCVMSNVAREYCRYIAELETGKVLAHLYTWHMGDLHGGQMIKKIIKSSHRNLEFENRVELIEKLRAKLDDGLADEANIAFDWAIRIMKEYDVELGV